MGLENKDPGRWELGLKPKTPAVFTPLPQGERGPGLPPGISGYTYTTLPLPEYAVNPGDSYGRISYDTARAEIDFDISGGGASSVTIQDFTFPFDVWIEKALIEHTSVLNNTGGAIVNREFHSFVTIGDTPVTGSPFIFPSGIGSIDTLVSNLFGDRTNVAARMLTLIYVLAGASLSTHRSQFFSLAVNGFYLPAGKAIRCLVFDTANDGVAFTGAYNQITHNFLIYYRTFRAS